MCPPVARSRQPTTPGPVPPRGGRSSGIRSVAGRTGGGPPRGGTMAEALTWDPLDGAGGRVAGVALPVTYAVGTVNCWIFPDRPVTLVDPGMLHAGGFERLQAALA